jgi:parallel beta-helix repeat protein
MSQADKDALSLAGALCCSLVERMDQLKLLLDSSRHPRVQPSTVAQLLCPPVASEASPRSSSLCPLTDLPVELLHSICLSKTMCSPEGGRSLSMLSRTCTIFGKVATQGGLSLVTQLAQTFCKDGGVCRLPMTMGDFWCWSRMLSWLSQSVRVGPQHELVTIQHGVDAAWEKGDAIEAAGGHLVEGSVLVLVEPGVYEEGLFIDEEEDGLSVSIWACDRESKTGKGETQRVEWKNRDECTLHVSDDVCVSVNGMTMSSERSSRCSDTFSCVHAAKGATLSLESCDLTTQFDCYVVHVSHESTTAVISSCCIHDGLEGGVSISRGAEATLLIDNDIHSNGIGVSVTTEGRRVVLRNNRLKRQKRFGVVIFGANVEATLEDNTISDNDWAGVEITDHSTVTLTGNTIKGNGQCKIELSREGLCTWGAYYADFYQGNGFPGMLVTHYGIIRTGSTVTVPPGSNTVEGNGKPGCTVVEVSIDRTASHIQ